MTDDKKDFVDVVNDALEAQGFTSESTVLNNIFKPIQYSSKGKWTKTAPTVPGVYWYRSDRDTIQAVRYKHSLGILWWFMYESPEPYTTEEMLQQNGQFWSEPLQVPE